MYYQQSLQPYAALLGLLPRGLMIPIYSDSFVYSLECFHGLPSLVFDWEVFDCHFYLSQCTYALVIDFGLLYTFGSYLCEYMHALT